MASSSPSVTSFSNSTVSQEEFNLFHNIDRMLYTKLVLNLERDPAESMQVMGFWIWLERAGHVRYLVHRLVYLTDALINSIAEEALLCLKCAQDEQFLHVPTTPLLFNMSKTGLSLRYFYENRVTVLSSVSDIMNQVCSRAFQDISAQAVTVKAMKGNVPFPNSSQNVIVPLVYGNTFIGSSSSSSHNLNQYEGGLPATFYDNIALPNQIPGTEIDDIFSGMVLGIGGEGEKDYSNTVPADDRTIFLTFSKGYPILEQEIREFFTRRFGECIEAIYMQEVSVEEHQPLYARFVVSSLGIIRKILEGKSKAKFSINGKHVWARKYIRKNPKSPPQPSSPSSLSTSPSPSAV